MVNWKSRKLSDILVFANGLVLLVLINLLASHYFFRADLTEEKRYSIKPQTRQMLKNLDDVVYIEVYLEGDLNAGFRRFQKNIRETLEEFRIYSDNKVRYTFTDPAAAIGQKAQSEFMADLAARGIQPTNVVENANGQRVEKIIFPGAVVSYGGLETGVMLLKGNKAQRPEEEINQSIEGVEYEVASAIYTLSNNRRKRIGLVTGHGELDSLDIAGFRSDMLRLYDVSRVTLDGGNTPLANFNALIIAKPTQPYAPADKYRLDQYIMQGGKVLFLVDKLGASMDSVSQENYLAFPYNLDLDDQLFRYGIRLNMDLVQDRTSAMFPFVTGQTQAGKPRIQALEWPFFPLINHYADHPITRNLDAVVTRFVSSVDTVKALGIKKTPLLFTSGYSRTVTAPVHVNLNILREDKAKEYTSSSIPIGYLLEGKFTSLYKNRFAPEGVDTTGFRGEGKDSRLVVIADGDLARNEINRRTGQPQAVGFDPYTNYTFANRDLLLNILAYLTDDGGLIQTRNKEVKIRPLDRERVHADKVSWQVLNLVVPLVLLVAYGVLRVYWRRRKYARF